MPADLFTMTTDATVTMDFSLATLLGEDWKSAAESLAEGLPQGAELTEQGFSVAESTSVPLTLRSLALTMIPVFAELICLFFFYRFLERAAKAVRFATFTPFLPEAAKNLKSAGIALFFMAGAVPLCGGLIALLTRGAADLSVSTGLDLMTVLWGFVLSALSYLFEYGAALAGAPRE